MFNISPLKSITIGMISFIKIIYQDVTVEHVNITCISHAIHVIYKSHVCNVCNYAYKLCM